MLAQLFNTVVIVGLGYIGLPTAAVLASRGVSVVGVDTNRHVVDTIGSGRIHIVEPELEALVHEVVRKGKLIATDKPRMADAFVIAVPTPFKGDHEPDVAFVRSATLAIAEVVKRGDLVILESTSPVGTTELVSTWLAAARPDLRFPHLANEEADVNVAYCPERVLPGNVIHELVVNDRVIGGLTRHCAERAAALYGLFVKGTCMITGARTAEMCKLTENAFRDLNIAFANELSLICDDLGINVWDLIDLANRHPRVKVLQPGPGVGGHCIAVDPWFIVHSSPKLARLIRSAREVNDNKPLYVVEKIESALRSVGKSRPVIAFFGLSFKANIDDLRGSPALDIVRVFVHRPDVHCIVVEPHISKLPIELLPAEFVSVGDALLQADIAVILVDHAVFKGCFNNLQPGLHIIDTRGLTRASKGFPLENRP